MYKEYLAESWYSAKALENSKVYFSTPTGGIYGEVGVNTFQNAIGAHYLPHSSEYVAPPSIDLVELTNGTNYPMLMSVNNWALKPNQPEEPPFTDHMLAIYAADTLVVFKAQKHLPKLRIKEATKGGSSKTPTSSKIGHSKKRKESSSAMESNPSQPIVSTPVDTGMHKEDQQATGGPTSLGVTASFIIHSESASGNDASAVSTTEADFGNSAPSDFVPQQQSMNEGIKNTLYDHLFAGTDPHVLSDQTKSVSEGLETVFTQPIIGKGASFIARQVKEEEEASSTIKLEDLAKLVSHMQPSFKDLDFPEDDPVIIVDDSDEDEKTEKDESQKHKLELEKNKAEAEAKAKAALLKDRPSFPNVEQLNQLLVKSLKTEFLNILSAHDFSSSLPTELKDLPSKLNELDLNKFTQVLDSASSKAGDQSVPSAGQVDTMPAEGEKNINQATNS
ncbi:hypothetical protein Tco_1343175 [Tanacetum coccineum]